ncbi:MAG TPA: penicillin-binding protein [Vicinamibacterales bacterium]|nr:penicillin-binding protein [Vicinamibacterales bacterium]
MIDVLQTTERPGEAFEAAWRPAIRRRVAFVFAGIALWGAVVEARLVWLQVVQHQAYLARATRQQNSVITPPAMRGDILDRRGAILAASADASALVADPQDVPDPVATAAALCRALGDCSTKEQATFVERLSSTKGFAYLRRWRAMSQIQAERVAALKLAGISLYRESGRYYPNMSLAAHVLGFVDINSSGLGGIEYVYDDRVRGVPGKVLARIDGEKHRLEERVEQPTIPGDTLQLTIDRDLQYIAERELEAGVVENRARGGTAIVVDPWTGEILALANYPTFNPNLASQADPDDLHNRATLDVYEPGSTFKIVTASAAIEEGVLKPTDLIDTNPGVITFPGRKPITEDSGHNYGVLTVEDVIVKSSNIGAIKIGLQTGAERLGRFARRFGFGAALGDDFTGESHGKVWDPAKMSDSTLASMSMGYNVSVTAVQMAMAASVIANGGTLYEPHLVSAFIRDGERQVVDPKPLRRAISRETAATLTTFMEGVVERGTAKKAQLDRFQVAGKTGTAKKLTAEGRYSDTDYNASFVGFVPSRRPVFTILVVIDTPRAGHTHGGDVAAPIFKRIAEAALQLEGVPPTINPTPPLVISADARRDRPVPQVPEVIPVLTPVGDHPVMPDVRGLAMRDAVRILTSLGLTVRSSGFGFVTSQTPEPGRAIESGEASTLELRRTAPIDPRAGSGGRE